MEDNPILGYAVNCRLTVLATFSGSYDIVLVL